MGAAVDTGSPPPDLLAGAVSDQLPHAPSYTT